MRNSPKKLGSNATHNIFRGPRAIELGDNDVAMVCLMRNGIYYLNILLSHHRALESLLITPSNRDRFCKAFRQSFNARFRGELLNGELLHTLREAQILIEQWRVHDNTVRPHSALGYRPPAPESHLSSEKLRFMRPSCATN